MVEERHDGTDGWLVPEGQMLRWEVADASCPLGDNG